MNGEVNGIGSSYPDQGIQSESLETGVAISQASRQW